jgi:hypothetical protein
MGRAGIAVGLVASCIAACTPALDWRELLVPGAPIRLAFPCKPQTHVRRVVLEGVDTEVTMSVCDAQDMSWALTVVNVGDPRRVAAVMQALRTSAAANLNTSLTSAVEWQVPGATPNALSGQMQLSGKKPDGKVVHESMGLFVSGLQVGMLAVLGPAPTQEPAQPFFASARVVQ